MRICPVCESKCDTSVCSRCGFDASKDYENRPTLTGLSVPVDSIAKRRSVFGALTACEACGGISFVIDSSTGQVICEKCKKPAVVVSKPDVTGEVDNPETKQKTRRRKWLLVPLAACLIILLSVFFYHPRDGWFERFGKTYYYVDGQRAVGMTTDNDRTFYFDSKGVLQTGWVLIGDETYYFNNAGIMQTGWHLLFYEPSWGSSALRDTGWYYFDDKGVLQTGWVTVDGDTYLISAVCGRQTGWKTLDDKTYYFSLDGVMQTGWQTIFGTKYYFDDSGALYTGWMTIDGEDFYFDQGIMLTGWRRLTTRKEAGIKLTLIAWYYFNDAGVLQTEWVTLKQNTYYVRRYIGRLTGLQTIDGKTYYFDKDGILQTDCSVTIDGVDYYFDENGVATDAPKPDDVTDTPAAPPETTPPETVPEETVCTNPDHWTVCDLCEGDKLCRARTCSPDGSCSTCGGTGIWSVIDYETGEETGETEVCPSCEGDKVCCFCAGTRKCSRCGGEGGWLWCYYLH